MNETELISAFASGTTHQHITSVYLQSENFVVFRIPGHKYWSGLGQPWSYAPTRYVLIRKGTHRFSGRRREWEGRATKRVVAEMEAALQQMELALASGTVV